MAYTPTEWKKGDIVTSEKLNKLENGVAAGGVLVVSVDAETGALDKTYAEIVGATLAVLKTVVDGLIFASCLNTFGETDGSYIVVFGEDQYTTNSEDGYPESTK